MYETGKKVYQKLTHQQKQGYVYGVLHMFCEYIGVYSQKVYNCENAQFTYTKYR